MLEKIKNLLKSLYNRVLEKIKTILGIDINIEVVIKEETKLSDTESLVDVIEKTEEPKEEKKEPKKETKKKPKKTTKKKKK